MKKVLLALFLVLIVSSVIMSTVTVFTEQAYATPLCPPPENKQCAWNPNWIAVDPDSECCCPRQYTGLATCR